MWRKVDSWERFQTDCEQSVLLATLRPWAEQFRITEDWIFEAALDTLAKHSYQIAKNGDSGRQWDWAYTPRGFHPTFEPVFSDNFWYPPHLGGLREDWKQFRKRMSADFQRQLSEYRTAIEKRFEIGREERFRMEAGWTARYQKGESVADIVQSIEIGNLADPEQTVYRAIERFAKNIALTLRKRGTRRKKRTTVQPKR
jgi:hypothetical protein